MQFSSESLNKIKMKKDCRKFSGNHTKRGFLSKNEMIFKSLINRRLLRQSAISAQQERERFMCVLNENLLHNQIGTVWIYCHTMDNMNIKTVRFGCERHTGFRCAANCFLPLQQSQLRLRVLFASEHAQRVGIGKRDLSSAETDQRLTLHVFQNAGDGFARRVDLAGQLFVGDTYGRAAA